MIYFAYGSNLHKKQMKNRCPDAVPLTKAKLKGYQLEFNNVADIVKKYGGVTWGAIYKVSLEDIKSLDGYEGYPRIYTKINVEVEDEQGSVYQAFAYVMNNKGLSKPCESYYKIIEEGYRNWQLPLKCLKEALIRSL